MEKKDIVVPRGLMAMEVIRTTQDKLLTVACHAKFEGRRPNTIINVKESDDSDDSVLFQVISSKKKQEGLFDIYETTVNGPFKMSAPDNEEDDND